MSQRQKEKGPSRGRREQPSTSSQAMEEEVGHVSLCLFFLLPPPSLFSYFLSSQPPFALFLPPSLTISSTSLSLPLSPLSVHYSLLSLQMEVEDEEVSSTQTSRVARKAADDMEPALLKRKVRHNVCSTCQLYLCVMLKIHGSIELCFCVYKE